MQVNTDEDGFVKKMTYTPGNAHDSKEFGKLLNTRKTLNTMKTDGEVYADSAYANQKKEAECLAACAGRPMMQIDRDYVENLRPDRIGEIVEGL